MADGESLNIGGDTLSPQQQEAINRAEVLTAIATQGVEGAGVLTGLATRPDGPLRKLAPPADTTE